tara:strand:- start:764 stop:991 length:228 start_codon:yes stop_codon:yes gene_type:complete
MEDHSLPEYLKIYISNENLKATNKKKIFCKDINKNMISQLDLFELQEYYKEIKEGNSFYYCNMRQFASTSLIYNT